MIISCSRRTDIPALYSNWLINRIQEGYVLVRNPMNRYQLSKISLEPSIVDCIVFWSKNPEPMISKIEKFKDFTYYFQFTLNPYENDIELNLPSKTVLVNTFRKLSDRIGKKKVIWRYDPIFLSESINIEYHISNFEYYAKVLSDYTDKCMISFIDMYRNVKSKLKDHALRSPDEAEMLVIAKAFGHIAKSYKIQIQTCAERIEIAELGITHGKCIDDRLISDLTGMKLNVEKDKNQRDLCGCVASIDIGEYNTCLHSCVYCYANFNNRMIENNFRVHNDKSPLLTGCVSDKSKVSERKLKSMLERQKSLFP